MKVLMIAALCHAANAAYCASIGDDTQVPWDAAPEWQKVSAMKGVEFCIAHPDASASANHDSWMAEKIAAGWVYGEVEDPSATPPTHPCIMSFDQLPPQQQFKDVLFKTIVAGCAGDDDHDVDTSAWDPAFVEGLTAERDQALQRATAAEAERDAATAKADKAAKAATVAKFKVAPTEASTKQRKLGPVDNGLSGEALAEALWQADADDKRVEIVVSDGTHTVTGIPPIVISGDVWRQHPLGRMLREPIKIEGPHTGGTPFVIHGFGLLIDGKQVAYCERPDVVQVAAGQTVNFADDIYF